MGLLEAFQLPGCRLWFHTGDHGPPHFHAGAVDAWEIRVYFLQDPPDYDESFAVRHVPMKMVREILRLAAAHRAALLDEWERSQDG
ncbi:MAG: DUF4160 domain-containing protein [Gemmatimonadetes bacterium]|nr:DUF4160 domain-containing protein [Gemmatimonadota bacterium]MYA64206.1 DUF4160 domain-containing protein [Gemmatimonadota bacterium]MYB98010.1 DUF4160 domain-containing protein [Gemmatimonadota bacterium]MYH54266.1 DUF4160 domain-containing protein [Gemmatimonadota bacterium]MYI45498.1 DUF4160 domain-containing protein [Gemmatimonadota bacterium]